MNRLPFLCCVLSAMAAYNQAQATPAELAGFEEAASICAALPFDSEKTRCLKEIRGKAFDLKALPICRAQGFVSHKLDCLEIVGDRFFTSAAELAVCQGMSFNSQQMQCLRDAGVGAFPAAGDAARLSVEDIEGQVSKALKSLERGRHDRAGRILGDLLNDLRSARNKKGA